MDDNTTGIIIVGLVVGLPTALGIGATVITSYMKHRLEAERLASARSSSELQKQLEHLQVRIGVLESQCSKLQDQVNTAHMMLADERRTLDQKLAAILPDTAADAEVASRNKPHLHKTIGS